MNESPLDAQTSPRIALLRLVRVGTSEPAQTKQPSACVFSWGSILCPMAVGLQGISIPEDISFLLEASDIKGGYITRLVFAFRAGNAPEFPIDLKKYPLQ